LSHPYLTIQGWQPLAKLKIGDKIAVPRSLNCFGNNSLSPGKIKILAYLIGDGCLTKTCPEFTNQNPFLQKDFQESLLEFEELKTTVETSNNTRTPTLRISKNVASFAQNRQIFAQNLKQIFAQKLMTVEVLASKLNLNSGTIYTWLQGQYFPQEETFNALCKVLNIAPETLLPCPIKNLQKNGSNSLKNWLLELELFGKNSHEKYIPEIIFTLKKSLVALFLNRLFATDGWASILKSGQVQLGYCSVSEKLARQVQHLLLRFGVISRLKKRSVKYQNSRRDAWQIDLTDAYSIKTFIEEIGIFGKEEKLSEIQQILSAKRYQTNCDLIPVEIWEQLKEAKGNQSWAELGRKAGFTDVSNLHVGKRCLSRHRLYQMALALEHLPLQQLANSEVYWDQIVTIEAMGLKQVYDLTIPHTHNFVANDICVHNTAFGLGIAANIAKEHQLPVAIFSLEMSKEQLAQRLLASEAKIESNRLRSGRISQTDLEPLGLAIGTLSELPIYIDDTANLTMMQIRSQVRRLQSERGQNLGLILLDYLQLMEGSGSDNRVQELSKITRSLKGLAREINAPVIALSQLSRGVEQRTNKRPMMSDLRESGSIEQDADMVIMLYRDSYYNPDSPDRNIAEVIIAKHRNGPTGVVKLLFQPELTRFENMARYHDF
jgi:replicative DNA helicase